MVCILSNPGPIRAVLTFAATILTLYPEMFPGPLGQSLAGKALERGDWSCETVNPRDFATDKHRTVDDTPAGGGAGMVLKADVLASALDSVLENQATRSLLTEEEGVRGTASPGRPSTRSLPGDNPGGRVEGAGWSGLEN